MKKTPLKYLFLVGLLSLSQSACFELLSGLTGGSSGTTLLGSNNSSEGSNQIVSSGTVESSSGESEFSDSDSVGIDIGPGIAKLERGTIDATALSGTVAMAESESIAQTGFPGGSATSTGTQVSIETVEISGTEDSIIGDCPDDANGCVADIVVRDTDTDQIIKRAVSNRNGSFRIQLPRRFKGRELELYVTNEAGENTSGSLFVTVYERAHYTVGLMRIPQQDTDIGIANGKLIFNVANRDNSDINNIVVINQSGGNSAVLAHDVDKIDNISIYPSHMVFDLEYDNYILATNENLDVVMHEEGDDDLISLSDFPNGSLDPMLGYVKRYSDISFATQPRGEFVATFGFQALSGRGLITLVPVIESDAPNDIYIRDNLGSQVQKRTLAFKGNDDLITMDNLQNGDYVARILDLRTVINLNPDELIIFKRANQAVINLPSRLIFSGNVPVKNPVTSKEDDVTEPFMVFECQLAGQDNWNICMNFYDESIVPLTEHDDGDAYDLTINRNNEFVAASIYNHSGGEAHIIVIHLPTGNVIPITTHVNGVQLRYLKTHFSDVDPYILTYLSTLPNGQLEPSIINLRLHPGAGQYVYDSPFCDSSLVECE